MKPYKRTIAASAFLASLALGTAAIAADLPKEGAFKGTFSSYGTYKTTKVGDVALTVFDETGPQLTDGFADHMALHCWGIGEAANGTGRTMAIASGLTPVATRWLRSFPAKNPARIRP